jgi:1,4-dihydroxy-2-naphthoyl-CoA hydrolase
VDALIDSMPFARHLGVEITSAGPEGVRARLAWAERLSTSRGVLHGGVVMALADTSGALCAFLNLPEGATTSTIESKTNFFRAVREGHIESVSRPLHVGRSTIVVQTDVYDAAGKRVAQVTQTQAVLNPTKSEDPRSGPPRFRGDP